MELDRWIGRYDRRGYVVLLEGKRKVLPEDVEKLRNFGRLLAEETRHCIFRSGNASGADHYFSQGVADIAPERLQLILPFEGHRLNFQLPVQSFSLDRIDVRTEDAIISQSLVNKKTAKLVERYLEGRRDPITMKASYIIRDTVKVLGYGDLGPAVFGFFYDDLSHPCSGGTGHTMHVCELNNVPLIDQSIFFNWLPG